jgi:pterin-4a-carbinolamine dehydratase
MPRKTNLKIKQAGQMSGLKFLNCLSLLNHLAGHHPINCLLDPG